MSADRDRRVRVIPDTYYSIEEMFYIFEMNLELGLMDEGSKRNIESITAILKTLPEGFLVCFEADSQNKTLHFTVASSEFNRLGLEKQ